MQALLIALAEYELVAFPKKSLSRGDMFIHSFGTEVRTVVAVTVEQGSGPRPTTVTLTTDDGKVETLNADLVVQPYVVRVSPRE